MELSRRGMLGGFAAAGAVGITGFAGAVSVADGEGGTGGGGDGDGGGTGGSGDGEQDSGDSEDSDASASVSADPDASFEARLSDVNDGDDEGLRLFGASDLERVQGPVSEDGEYRVYVALGDPGIDAFQTRLNDAGATDDPSGFVVSMTLNDQEVRRVELDEPTVDALTDTEWGGVLTLPFDDEAVAADVYESLAES